MMQADKKRRSRVQGGWAPPTNVKSDRNKPKAPTQPNWLGKNVDQPVDRKFVFEKPTEDIRQKPADKLISKPGVYDISTEPSGISRYRFIIVIEACLPPQKFVGHKAVNLNLCHAEPGIFLIDSRLRLFPAFVEPKEADEWFDALYHDLPWRQRSDTKNGETFLQPRLTAWFGEHKYSYSGVTHEACTEWPVALVKVKSRVEEVTGIHFNSVLANLYRDGHDSVAWHADDEPTLGPEPTIASVSFGDTRTFQLRKNPPPEEKGDYTYSQQIEVPLTHGSLLIMEGASQTDWQHRIPREYHDRSARINLTFRVIYPS